ncbi:MAG TPA: hypothetical protein VJ732_10740, partial [Bryobacteraceae bacterium]|nr:hypothetical protein [Bryobacteraceae bacterium]
AGWQAQQRLALRECVAYLQRAVSLLETLPEDDPARLRSEMEAQLALGQALTATFGWASRELEASCLRARDLCQRLGNRAGLQQALLALSGMYFLRGSLHQSVEVAKSVLAIAIETNDPLLQIEACHAISYPTYFLGDFPGTREYAEKGLALYTPERERAVVATFHVPSSFACAHILAMSLWCLGYPEEAKAAHRRSMEMIEALDLSACTAFALGCSLDYHYHWRDHATIARKAEQVYRLSLEEGYLFWVAQTRILGGWARAMSGDPEAGIKEMQAGLESYRVTGSGLLLPEFSLMMAEAELRAGRLPEALAAISQGLAQAAENDERIQEAELHRLDGEIRLLTGDESGGEASLLRAIEVARGQQSKASELRAAVALARRRGEQGRPDEARALVAPLVEWYRGASGIPELDEARAIVGSNGQPKRRVSAATIKTQSVARD